MQVQTIGGSTGDLADGKAVHVTAAITPWIGIVFIMRLIVEVSVGSDLLDRAEFCKLCRFAVCVMSTSGGGAAGRVVGPDLNHHVLDNAGGLDAQIRAIHHVRVWLGKEGTILG